MSGRVVRQSRIDPKKDRLEKKGPLDGGAKSAWFSLCESLLARPLLLLWLDRWLRRSTLRGGLREELLRRTNR